MLFPGLTWPVQSCPNKEALEVVFAECGLDSLGRGDNKAQDSSPDEIALPPWVLPVLGYLPLCSCCYIRSPSTPSKVTSAWFLDGAAFFPTRPLYSSMDGAREITFFFLCYDRVKNMINQHAKPRSIVNITQMVALTSLCILFSLLENQLLLVGREGF